MIKTIKSKQILCIQSSHLYCWRIHGTPKTLSCCIWPVILFYFHSTDTAVFYFRWSLLSTKGKAKLLYLQKKLSNLDMRHRKIVKLLMPIPPLPCHYSSQSTDSSASRKDIMIKLRAIIQWFKRIQEHQSQVIHTY